MKNYVIKRVILTIPLLIIISFVCFAFINLIPSDPAEVALRVSQVPIITEEVIEEFRETMGLSGSFLERYFSWLKNCLKGNFGVSYINPSRTVLSEMKRSLPATLKLASSSLALVILTSIPIGFLCAIKKDSIFDRIVRGIIFILTSMPSYWIGLILIWVFSLKFDLLPTSGLGGFKNLILPTITVSLSYISTYIRLVRNNMIENMKKDYAIYARVRGLSNFRTLVYHVLRNSLHTCFVAIGMSIPQLIAGTIVVENVFAWPGLGSLCISSIFNRDYPIIQAYVLFIGVLFVIFNLLFDILHAATDPRIRLGE